MSDDLPQGWCEAVISDAADVFLGKTPAKTDYASSGRLKVIKFRDLQEGRVDFFNPKDGFVRENSDAVSGLRELHSGDVLITSAAHSGENIGKKCAYVSNLPEQFAQVFFTGELLNIRCPYDTLSRWAYLFFRSANGFSEIQEAVTGVHLTGGRAKQMRLPLAPMAEQQRVVVKLEKLLGRVDACQMRLAKIPTLLKRFRQAVLAAACSGGLTADWRATHKTVRPAQNIVQSLKTPDPESYLDIFERSSDSEIPETWSWVCLGKLGPLVGGGTPSTGNSKFWSGTIPWVSPKDMKRNRIRDSEDHITELGLKSSSVSKIDPGAILFVVRGMILNHTLPTAITDVPVTLNQDMKALVPEMRDMSEYLSLAARHVALSILFEVKEATHGTRRIESSVLKNWAIPLPPLEEQQEIVRRVEGMFALADRLEARFVEARKRVNSITQSVLAKAFRGELVPTEFELAKAEGRSFESAEELLKRIGRNGEPKRKKTKGSS